MAFNIKKAIALYHPPSILVLLNILALIRTVTPNHHRMFTPGNERNPSGIGMEQANLILAELKH